MVCRNELRESPRYNRLDRAHGVGTTVSGVAFHEVLDCCICVQHDTFIIIVRALSVQRDTLGGLGVLFGVNQEGRLLACGNKLQLMLELPGCDPMEITVDPRHRRLMGASIRYGIPFLPEETENFEEKRLQIYRYVHRRQIEMIEALRAMPA